MAGNVERMGRKLCRRYWQENLKEGEDLEEPGLDGRVILSRHKVIVLQGVNWINMGQHRKKAGCCK